MWTHVCKHAGTKACMHAYVHAQMHAFKYTHGCFNVIHDTTAQIFCAFITL